MVVLEILYFMLPVYLANMMPVLVKNYFKKLAFPLDFNKTFRGKPILGSHKTFRGLFFGVLVAVLVFYIQKLININSIIDYSEYSIFLGFLLGFGAIAGDSIESFFKRRIGVKSGDPWIPFDQMDYSVGALLFSSFVLSYSLLQVVLILVISTLGHILINHIAFYLKIRDEKW